MCTRITEKQMFAKKSHEKTINVQQKSVKTKYLWLKTVKTNNKCAAYKVQWMRALLWFWSHWRSVLQFCFAAQTCWSLVWFQLNTEDTWPVWRRFLVLAGLLCCLWRMKSSRIASRVSSFVSWRWTKLSEDWNSMRRPESWFLGELNPLKWFPMTILTKAL